MEKVDTHQSPDKGRCLLAKTDIRSGETVLKEFPLITWIAGASGTARNVFTSLLFTTLLFFYFNFYK
jgi:hypothetical protein